jgi:hypothetical protein
MKTRGRAHPPESDPARVSVDCSPWSDVVEVGDDLDDAPASYPRSTACDLDDIVVKCAVIVRLAHRCWTDDNIRREVSSHRDDGEPVLGCSRYSS